MSTEERNLRDVTRGTVTGLNTQDNWALGCLLRIADATELMAQSHARLIADKENAERNRDLYYKWFTKSENRVRGLRGAITVMRRARK